MIYNALMFYGIKLKIKANGIAELMAIFDGRHASTAKAISASLDVYVRSMKGYLRYEPDDAYLFVGKRLIGADLDRPVADMALSEVDPAELKKIDALLLANGYTAEPPRLHLICDHSD